MESSDDLFSPSNVDEQSGVMEQSQTDETSQTQVMDDDVAASSPTTVEPDIPSVQFFITPSGGTPRYYFIRMVVNRPQMHHEATVLNGDGSTTTLKSTPIGHGNHSVTHPFCAYEQLHAILEVDYMQHFIPPLIQDRNLLKHLNLADEQLWCIEQFFQGLAEVPDVLFTAEWVRRFFYEMKFSVMAKERLQTRCGWERLTKYIPIRTRAACKISYVRGSGVRSTVIPEACALRARLHEKRKSTGVFLHHLSSYLSHVRHDSGMPAGFSSDLSGRFFNEWQYTSTTEERTMIGFGSAVEHLCLLCGYLDAGVARLDCILALENRELCCRCLDDLDAQQEWYDSVLRRLSIGWREEFLQPFSEATDDVNGALLEAGHTTCAST